MQKIDFTGKKFGRLTAVRFSGRVGKRRHWLCDCECGGTVTVAVSNLTGGGVRSCGCLKLEAVAKAQGAARKHGETLPRTTEYRAWVNMQDRCYNPKNPSHRYYIGITVCPRWQESFENFLADMGRKPTPKHSLDRWPNNAGNYEPGNCRWATSKEQIHNRRPRAAKQKDALHV